MGAPRDRVPNTAAAEEIARAFYADVDEIKWIPSDDADVFRLALTSDREPRILKLETHGIKALHRELGAFPAMRALGVVELLEFEHTLEELPEIGLDFHITAELENPAAANQALAEAWRADRSAALDLAEWLGDCMRRIERLDWWQVARANPLERCHAGWSGWRRHYEVLLRHPDAPLAAGPRGPDGLGLQPTAFGGWLGELLKRPDGSFVLIDWPTLRAAPLGAVAAIGLEKLLAFRSDNPAPLASRFLDGWSPSGPSRREIEYLRLWLLDGILGWTGLAIDLGDTQADPRAAFAAAEGILQEGDPAAWLTPAADQGPQL